MSGHDPNLCGTIKATNQVTLKTPGQGKSEFKIGVFRGAKFSNTPKQKGKQKSLRQNRPSQPGATKSRIIHRFIFLSRFAYHSGRSQKLDPRRPGRWLRVAPRTARPQTAPGLRVQHDAFARATRCICACNTACSCACNTACSCACNTTRDPQIALRFSKAAQPTEAGGFERDSSASRALQFLGLMNEASLFSPAQEFRSDSTPPDKQNPERLLPFGAAAD